MSDVFVAGGLGDWRAQIRLDPSTGDLEFVDAFQAEPGDFTIDELRPLTFSADGRHAYICVQGFGGGGGIEAYRRDETTGRLTLFAYLQSTNHEFNCADMTMSPTGSWLYTVGRWNDYLVTYQRYHSSGLLLFVNQTRE
jgi:6-phosphogluconolactonase (cycloisomerase 2 family)